MGLGTTGSLHCVSFLSLIYSFIAHLIVLLHVSPVCDVCNVVKCKKNKNLSTENTNQQNVTVLSPFSVLAAVVCVYSDVIFTNTASHSLKVGLIAVEMSFASSEFS